jgi:hypothetical protein
VEEDSDDESDPGEEDPPTKDYKPPPPEYHGSVGWTEIGEDDRFDCPREESNCPPIRKGGMESSVPPELMDVVALFMCFFPMAYFPAALDAMSEAVIADGQRARPFFTSAELCIFLGVLLLMSKYPNVAVSL